MRRKLFWSLIVMTLLTLLSPAALAGHGQYHIDYTDEPPQSVLDHLDKRWPAYTLEDYCELDGESLNVGIALVEKKGHRVLVMYRRKNGEMTLWFDTDKAVPQGGGEAWFDKTGKQVFKEGSGWTHVPDNMGFAVTRYDLVGDTYNQMVMYSWQDKGFHLTDFYDLDAGDVSQTADVDDGVIAFYAYGEGNGLGKVYGEIQTDLRYVSFEKLPKTLKEAKSELTVAPDDLPSGKILGSGGQMLTAKEVKFSGGRNYPVYLGPGESYMRSGNGKGAVSTNDWIQVFGKYNDYIMIQYDISAERFRIGWIEAKALPSGANVPELKLLLPEDYGEVIDKCVLTDDPFNSESPIATLKPGTPICEIVYNMGGWSYIRVTIDGKDVCGFVPSDCISHG